MSFGLLAHLDLVALAVVLAVIGAGPYALIPLGLAVVQLLSAAWQRS